MQRNEIEANSEYQRLQRRAEAARAAITGAYAGIEWRRRCEARGRW